MSKNKQKPVKPRNEDLFLTLVNTKPGKHKTGKKDKKTRRKNQEKKEIFSEIY